MKHRVDQQRPYPVDPRGGGRARRPDRTDHADRVQRQRALSAQEKALEFMLFDLSAASRR